MGVDLHSQLLFSTQPTSLSDGALIAEVIDGPLKGERRKVVKTGATLGRSPDNTLSISDPELSRRHSKIEYDESDGKVGSSDRYVSCSHDSVMTLFVPWHTHSSTIFAMSARPTVLICSLLDLMMGYSSLC